MYDQTLHFGGMSMVEGQAFQAGNGQHQRRIPVAKQYQVIGGRRFLIERVRYQQIKGELLHVPAAGPPDEQPGHADNGTSPRMRSRDLALRSTPKPPKSAKQFSIAMEKSPVPVNTPGFIMDWDYVYDGYDWSFNCPDTYVVSGETHLTSAYFDPQVVVKQDLGSSLYVDGPLTCGDSSSCGSGYAIITSINDTSYGEDIDWYSNDGSPSYGDYGPGLAVYPAYLSTAQAHIQDLYGDPGITTQNPPPPTITVSAPDNTATKGASPANTGTLTITRVDGDWSQSLTVQLAISGTAVPGVDYRSVASTVTFAPNAGTTNITVMPSAYSGNAPESTVVVGVQPDPNNTYYVGSPGLALVYIDDPAAPFPQATAVPAGLVGWWRGETIALDSAGTNNGTLIGVGYTNGMVANGFYFHGSDRLNVNDSPVLDFGTNADFSVECWIQPISATTDWGLQSIVNKRLAPSCNCSALGWEFTLQSGQLLCQMADAPLGSGFSTFGPTGPDLRDGRLHHIALTVHRASATGGTIYVDGTVVLIFNPSLEPGDLSTTEPLRIGCHANTNLNAYFTGTIDEVSIYSRALSTNEVVSIFVANRAGKFLDQDSNGLLDAWELQNFGHIGVAANADPDGDGLSNLQEYLLGTNPNKAAAADASGVVDLQVYTPLK